MRRFILVAVITGLGAAATAQVKISDPQQLARYKPSEPLLPTAAACDRLDGEWIAFLNAVAELRDECQTKNFGRNVNAPIRALGQCCIDYYGNPVPELCQRGAICAAIDAQWFCLANERKSSVARCRERAASYKDAVDLVNQKDSDKSDARNSLADVHERARDVGEKVFDSTLAQKIWEEAMKDIARSQDATLRELEKLKPPPSTVNAPPTRQQAPNQSQPTAPSQGQSQNSDVKNVDDRAVKCAGAYLGPGPDGQDRWDAVNFPFECVGYKPERR